MPNATTMAKITMRPILPGRKKRSTKFRLFLKIKTRNYQRYLFFTTVTGSYMIIFQTASNLKSVLYRKMSKPTSVSQK